MAASLLALGPTLLIGYVLHVAVTFEAKASPAAFLRYGTGIIAGYPVWLATLFLLCNMLKLSVVVAGPLGTLLMFFWNYALTHWAFLGSNYLAVLLRLRRSWR
jgi:putative flippase GtrA